MCTIGWTREAGTGRTWTFKQCDLVEPTLFDEPAVAVSDVGIRYVAFRRDGSTGPWAGFNEHGVGFVAADAYLAADDDVNPEQPEPADLLEAYEDVLATCTTPGQAVDSMRAFYETHRPADIILVTGPRGAVLVESSPSHGVHVSVVHDDDEAGEDEDAVFACTNHFLFLPGGVTPSENRSSHLRLARARELLGEDSGPGGLARLLTDQDEGPSTLSVCRVANEDDEYSTQAAVAWAWRADGGVDCAYVLNGNPREKAFTTWRDVFGEGTRDAESAVCGDETWMMLGMPEDDDED